RSLHDALPISLGENLAIEKNVLSQSRHQSTSIAAERVAFFSAGRKAESASTIVAPAVPSKSHTAATGPGCSPAGMPNSGLKEAGGMRQAGSPSSVVPASGRERIWFTERTRPAELRRAGVRQEEDLVRGEDTTSRGLAVVPLDLREVVVAQDSVDVRQSRTALDTVDDLDLEVLVLQEGTNDLRRSQHGGRPTAIVLVLVQIGSVDQVIEELGGIIREQLRQSEGQLGITTKVVIHPVVLLGDGRTASLDHSTAETLRCIANRRGRVVGGVHHELPSHRVALRGSDDGLRLENGDTAGVGDQREHTSLVCSAARTLRLSIPVTGLRSEEHTSELQSRFDLVCRLLLEK